MYGCQHFNNNSTNRQIVWTAVQVHSRACMNFMDHPGVLLSMSSLVPGPDPLRGKSLEKELLTARVLNPRQERA